MKDSLFCVGIAAALALQAQGAVPAWPMFRGPNAAGVSASAKPPTKIGPQEKRLWRIDVPASPSSPCVWDNRIYLTTFDAGRLQVRSYSRSDGHQMWLRTVPAEKLETYHGTEGSPAAGTPATDGEHVVAYFGSFGLICFNENGKELWRQRLPVAETSGNFGSGTSPLIVGDKVILNRDVARGSSIFAFNLKTGEKVWETPRVDAPTSYSTPVVAVGDAGTTLVVAGSLFMRGYDPANGKERWNVSGLPSFTCTTPAVADGMIYFAGWAPGKADSPWPTWASTAEKMDKNGDGKIALDEYADGPVWFKAQDIDSDGWLTEQDWNAIGGLMKRGENVLLAVKSGGHGDVTATHVPWKFERGLPYVPSPVFYEGRVYLVKDGGMASCFDAKTGKPYYVQERLGALGNYYASPVAADGRIYVSSLDGKLTVYRAGGDKPEILHQADFGERIAATPALIGNALYLRTQSKLYAFGE